MTTLKPGTILRETDLYRSSSGQLEPVPCPGFEVIDNGVEFFRPSEEITPELLARLRYGHREGGYAITRGRAEIFDLLEVIAQEKGWDLDKVDWSQLDGTKMRGLEES